MDKNLLINNIYNVSSYGNYVNKTVFDTEKVGSPIYGEVEKIGTDAIINKFKDRFNKDTIFYDLGSGLSKMVFHIGIQCDVKKSVGIEYSKERHQGAMDIKEKYAKEYDNIMLICGNLLDVDFSDATVVYTDNTVFPESVMEQIYDKISTDCLFLYKRPLMFLPADVKQNKENKMVKRTYNQNGLTWLIKK